MELQNLEPTDGLPHGAGLRFLAGAGRRDGDAFIFEALLSEQLSIAEVDSTIAPEAGLEMMAQACGMVLANAQADGASFVDDLKVRMSPRRGVVGAVRGYEYAVEPFRIGERVIVRVCPDVVEPELLVCDAEIVRGDNSVCQRARITLIVQGNSAEVS